MPSKTSSSTEAVNLKFESMARGAPLHTAGFLLALGGCDTAPDTANSQYCYVSSFMGCLLLSDSTEST